MRIRLSIRLALQRSLSTDFAVRKSRRYEGQVVDQVLGVDTPFEKSSKWS